MPDGDSLPAQPRQMQLAVQILLDPAGVAGERLSFKEAQNAASSTTAFSENRSGTHRAPRRWTAVVIDRAIGLVAGRLGDSLRAAFRSPDELLALTAPVDGEGKTVDLARNRLLMFVVGVTQETAARGARVRTASLGGGASAVAVEPIHLNVDVMLAANFDPENYVEALKILSHAVRFFQANPVFDGRSAPDMDRGLSQLAMEMSNLDIETASQLWGVHGGRYMPSALYRMRLVAIDPGAVLREAPPVRAPQATAGAAG